MIPISCYFSHNINSTYDLNSIIYFSCIKNYEAEKKFTSDKLRRGLQVTPETTQGEPVKIGFPDHHRKIVQSQRSEPIILQSLRKAV